MVSFESLAPGLHRFFVPRMWGASRLLRICVIWYVAYGIGIAGFSDVGFGQTTGKNSEQEGERVWVKGHVMNPGLIKWTPELTVFSAILQAGGYPMSNPKFVYILRKDNRIPVAIQKVRKNEIVDPPLLPGDTVEVPEY